MYTREGCVRYINWLDIPENMEVELLEIRDAVSMTSGYNEGMKASHAKYKVYMHQDIFLTNKYLIHDIIRIFRSDEKIGMIGLVGCPVVPENAIMWDAKRVAEGQGTVCREGYRYSFEKDGLWDEEAVDGMFMVTQYDVPWREDLFDGWDYYDISQSFEMRRRGYRVVVPVQNHVWYVHDDKMIVSLWDYEKYRRIFLREYEKDFGKNRETMMEKIKTFIIIVTCNEIKNLQECIESIRNFSSLEDLNVVVIDNASEDGTREWLEEQSDIAYAVETEYCESWGKLVNEAIDAFGIDGDIIFMLARHRVTVSCIEQMKEALYLQENIGAVAPLINGNNLGCHGLTEKAENGSPRIKRGIRLEEEIIMLRHDVIGEVGLPDENFYTFKFAIVDYQLRLVKQALKLYCIESALAISTDVCNRMNQREDEDLIMLRTKWGMNYFIAKPNRELITMMTHKENEQISVLEVGCDCGATLLELTNVYPNAEVYGYEINQKSADFAATVAAIEVGNVEEKNLPYEKNKFDYILFGDVLEHLHNPEEVVEYCRDFLKKDGCIIACIPNLMHISVIKNLLEGYFTYRDMGVLDRTHVHMFTMFEVAKMFTDNGYEIEYVVTKEIENSKEEEDYMDKILSITSHEYRYMFEAFQYVVRARKIENY